MALYKFKYPLVLLLLLFYFTNPISTKLMTYEMTPMIKVRGAREAQPPLLPFEHFMPK